MIATTSEAGTRSHVPALLPEQALLQDQHSFANNSMNISSQNYVEVS